MKGRITLSIHMAEECATIMARNAVIRKGLSILDRSSTTFAKREQSGDV
jgi:hypothetical protein